MLSKIIIFVTRHNSSSATFTRFPVVNCFQKLLSSWHDTTILARYKSKTTLRIAFKNYYLRDTTQPTMANKSHSPRCELLSKIIIFVTRHNTNLLSPLLFSVVNCFQKLLSSWHDTTNDGKQKPLTALWIAFKNYYLRDTTQLNNFQMTCSGVVNCFQKLLSSWHDTTYHDFIEFQFLLWIAFKNYYLRDTTQRSWMIELSRSCCELLSKIIIFVTRHNALEWLNYLARVVNCFQKLLSSWHDTTNHRKRQIAARLWIAFKNYYLRDTTQPDETPALFYNGCELLSKIIIFVTRHNRCCVCNGKQSVVNCFQKLLSSWHDTTLFLNAVGIR